MVALRRRVPGHARHRSTWCRRSSSRSRPTRTSGPGTAISSLGLRDAADARRRRRRVVRPRGLPRPRADDDRAVSALRRTVAACGAAAGLRRSPTCATCRCGRSWPGSTRPRWPRDARVQRLVGKGRGFDEHDKAALRARRTRDAAAGGAGVSRGRGARARSSCRPRRTSIPILPLLCDSAAHHDAHPAAPLPEPPFRHPGRRRAAAGAGRRRAHSAGSASRPRGVWPSEGQRVRRRRPPRSPAPGSAGWPPTRTS